MAPEARVNISFHPVGHGLFSSVSVYTRERSFNLLFDCGSHIKCRKALSKALDKFLARGPRDIDILVISHLHYDHVSGVVKLLSHANVKTVVLPYIPPEERLLIAVHQPIFPLPPWYRSFLVSPASFLAGLGVEEVRFLRGTGEEGPPELPLTRPPEEPPEAQGRFGIIWPEAAENIPADELRQAENVKETLGVLVVFTKVDGHAFLALRRVPPIYAFLVFFLYPVREDALNIFKRCLYSELGITAINPETIRQLLSRAEDHKKLRRCYEILAEKIGGARELNFTCLSLLILLAFYDKGGKTTCSSVEIPSPWPYPFLPISRPYTIMSLLTGDLRLDVNKIWKAFENRYGGILKSRDRCLLIFQVPHHGSRRGFNADIIDYLRYSSSPCLSVISCSAYGLYNLPSKRVVRSLMSAAPLKICTEVNPVSILCHIF